MSRTLENSMLNYLQNIDMYIMCFAGKVRINVTIYHISITNKSISRDKIISENLLAILDILAVKFTRKN